MLCHLTIYFSIWYRLNTGVLGGLPLVSGARQVVSASKPHVNGKREGVSEVTPYMGVSDDAIYGICGRRRGVSISTPHISGAGQRARASLPYTGGKRGGVYATMSSMGEKEKVSERSLFT